MSAKTIAVINFKGGVGKTTVTWCLGKVLSEETDWQTLMFDLDPQMSLTEAIGLNENTGHLDDKFGKWYERSIKYRQTIYDAIEVFRKAGQNFKFPVGFDSIYQIDEQLHFIPAVEELYWLELEGFEAKNVKDFIRRFVGKITNSSHLPNYDFILFDCSPSFNLLSYSVLSCCDLVLIPVNPDYFGSRGLSLLLNSLKRRIEPFPFPKIAVFMNRAKTYGGLLTNEVQFYMREDRRICAEAAAENNIQIKFLESTIRETVGIKRAISEGELPADIVTDFEELWRECAGVPEMKKEEMFQPDEAEVGQLTDEIAELKEMAREISRKLTRIETKVKRGLSSVPKSSELKVSQSASHAKKPDNLSAEQVLEVYEELRLKAKDGNEEEVKQKLSDMNLTDLNLLCWELGASANGKNLSRKKLLDAILGRIKQSLMLSRHIDRRAL